MKFGSVKFFKAAILITTALLIIVPSILSVFFSIKGAYLSGELTKAKQQLDEVQANQLKQPNDTSEPPNVEPPNSNSVAALPPSFEYQNMFENLYVQPPDKMREDEKVAYLTFDDGPSPNTLKVLELLQEHDIKATFFVTGPSSEKYPEYMKAIAQAGHTLAIHTYSHIYTEIYSSVEAYLTDFEQMYTIIYEASGIKPNIFRFPGGSINSYNRSIYQEIIAEMTRRGFTYYDWNVSSGDVAVRASTEKITSNVLNGSLKQRRSIILLHDRLDTGNTLSALPDIIKGLTEQGYTFSALENDVRPVTFSYQK